MPKSGIRNGNSPRAGTTKYDAHHKVLSQTYGAFADLRRELSDSKTTVHEREEMLRSFAACPDSQRAWLLLEDYFEKLLLSRKDFPDTNWWPKLLNAQGKTRLEELAFLFLRAKRSVPPELSAHASLDRFAKAEEAEQEVKLVQELEDKFEKVTVEKAAMVCLIGSNMDRPGLLAKSAMALADNNINIKSAGFALRKVNIQFLIAREDFDTAIIALNKAMG